MSNIVIQEYDYTTAGNPQYSNFGVVVPGFVMNTYADMKAAIESLGINDIDDNGVIEFKLASDFKQVIGLGEKSYEGTIPATAPVIQNIAEVPAIRYSTADFTEYTAVYNAHNKTGNKDAFLYGFDLYDALPEGKTAPGKLTIKAAVKYHAVENGGYFEYLGESDAEITYPEQPVSPEADATYVAYVLFKKFPRTTTETAYNDAIKYNAIEVTGYNAPVLILIGDEGTDEQTITATKQFGNQFAYELLGLGYPVLYKILNKIDYTDPTHPVFDPTEIEDIGADEFWEPLTDRSVYDFRYVITGLLENNTTANNAISKLASFTNQQSSGRGDVIALCDVDKSKYISASNPLTQLAAAKKIAEAAAYITNADKFAGIFAPTVEYAYSSQYYTNSEFSGSFHYLMCAANSINSSYKEWFANSGYQRGLGQFTVIGTPGVKLGDQAVKYLQPRVKSNGVTRAINLIIKIKDNYYLWGNRTAQPLTSEGLKASHFLNIRQLCVTLNKQIYETCKRFTFDPNSLKLWINFKNAIRPTLESMKADQGIEDYAFELLPSTQKAELRARVKIVPIEAVEDFYIGIALVDSIEDVTVSVTED